MMPATLDGPRYPPASGGKPKQIVIMLHGYGADGTDLIALAKQWSVYVPDAAFVAPHAPEPCMANPMGGRQWFPLTSGDPEQHWQGVNAANDTLRDFIESEAEKAGLPLSSVALLGFSQGTMMALHTGPRLDRELAGIVGFSGHLAGAERLRDEVRSRPPVLLVHGAADQVISIEAIHNARVGLASADIPVVWSIRPNLGHGIDPAGLQLAGTFLRNAF